MERRLVEEREHACDEAVIELGNDRHTYAESILKTCKFCAGLSLPCVSGITGADLERRIIYIMSQPVVRKLDLRKKIWLGLATVVVIAAPFLFGLASGTGQSAAPQSADAANETLQSDAEFEVVSIKQNKNASGMVRFGLWGERFMATGRTLQGLIQESFEIEEDQLAGGPHWVKSESYDVEAKVDHSVAEHLHQLSFDQRMVQYHRMLRTVLADRCKLTFHWETKELPVYALMVVKKKGSQISEAKPGNNYPNGIKDLTGQGHGDVMRIGRGFLQGQGVSIGNGHSPEWHSASLVHLLSWQLGRPVIDKTGLTAKYDFTLQWTPDQSAPTFSGPGGGGPDSSTSSESGPSIFTAIQEQLGLKLESQKGAVEILVIDHVERPSEN
jgi:uncharacterized protein (TIGR03435 family)